MSRLRLGFALVVVTVFAALLGASSASAATVVNGNFESGNLEGWDVSQSNPGVEWLVSQLVEDEPPLTHFVAHSEQHNPGTAILSQLISLESGATHQLQLAFGYVSDAPIAIPTPNSLNTEGSFENQQVRIDVMKPTAPITSLAPGDILTTIFASSEAENVEGEVPPAELPPRLFSADLSAFAGQTVRLRIAVAVTNAPLEALVDNVSVTSTLLPKPVVPTPPPVSPPSNVFTKGALKLNKKNGTGFLSVNVPDAGVLTASDVRRKLAVATAKGKTKPVVIRTSTVASAAAGTITVPIKATPAGMKILKRTGKLGFALNLTFTPTGGIAATQGYKGKLIRTVRPAPRQ